MSQPFELDKALILDRLGGDEEIFAMMVDMFLQDLDSYCNNLLNAYRAGEVPVVQREAHTIKGLLASFSDDVGAKEAHAIELAAKQGSIDGLLPQVEALNARLVHVADVLRGAAGNT